jgi:hypothetical protein
MYNISNLLAIQQHFSEVNGKHACKDENLMRQEASE